MNASILKAYTFGPIIKVKPKTSSLWHLSEEIERRAKTKYFNFNPLITSYSEEVGGGYHRVYIV
jgi:hypothetical protein